jgi:hypothetical protein
MDCNSSIQIQKIHALADWKNHCKILNDEKWFNSKHVDMTLCKMVLTYSNNDMLEMIELVKISSCFRKRAMN